MIKRTFCFFLGAALHSAIFAGTLEFELAEISTTENASSLAINVTRSGSVGGAASVTVRTTSGTATAGEDFNNIQQVLSWTAGDATSKSASISIFDDSLVEGAESFTLSLTNFVGDTGGANAFSDVTITDYEEGAVSFSSTLYIVDEEEGSASIVVIRQLGFDGEVSFTLTAAPDTALVSSDFEATDTVLTFLDGESLLVADIPLINDNIGELTESFTLTLSEVSTGASLGSYAESTVSINDLDTNFTAPLELIDSSSSEIVQTFYLDLAQPSIADSSIQLLDTINSIDVLNSTELLAAQNSNGLLELDIGSETIYLSPLEVIRAEEGAEPAILLNDDLSGQFVTEQGVAISFQPGLQGVSTLQEELALLSMPMIEVNRQGNIVIQINQGPPPLEINNDGAVVVNNSYWDRFNLRPSPIGFVSEDTSPGVKFVPHPTLPSETSVLVVFADEQIFRQQLLNSAPLDSAELVQLIEANTAFSDSELVGSGILNFKFNGGLTSVFSDYIVRRSIDFDSSKVGIFATDDLNGDGLNDFNVIYNNGDEQYFFALTQQI